MKLAAVVVTFNRKILLGECLEALLAQTRPLDAIYVVDNASSDGTPEYLRDSGLLDREPIHYMRLTANLGGAGGFHAGMKAAYEAGSDWIWIMDDDAIADQDALAAMLPFTADDHVCAVANQKLDRDRNAASSHIRKAAPDPAGARPYERLAFSSFVGLMVRKEAVARVGLPKAEFFVYEDDREYCYRLNEIGDIAFAPLSRIVHKELSKAEKRKQFFGRAHRSLPTAQFCMLYFGIRNHLWVNLHAAKTGALRAFAFEGKRCASLGLRAILIDREDVLVRLWILARGYCDGIRENFDNGFPFRMRARLK